MWHLLLAGHSIMPVCMPVRRCAWDLCFYGGWPGCTLGYSAGPRGRWDTAQSSTALTLCPVAAAMGMTASTLGMSLNTWAASSTSLPKRRSTCSHSAQISLRAAPSLKGLCISTQPGGSVSPAAGQARVSLGLNSAHNRSDQHRMNHMASPCRCRCPHISFQETGMQRAKGMHTLLRTTASGTAASSKVDARNVSACAGRSLASTMTSIASASLLARFTLCIIRSSSLLLSSCNVTAGLNSICYARLTGCCPMC